MSSSYEYIIGLMNPNGAGSSTLDQHCSAMRMDRDFSFTSNQLSYAHADAKTDVKRWGTRETGWRDTGAWLLPDGFRHGWPCQKCGGLHEKLTKAKAKAVCVANQAVLKPAEPSREAKRAAKRRADLAWESLYWDDDRYYSNY